MSEDLEQLRKDAARWRFIRKFFGEAHLDFPIHEDPQSPAHADALIDAAIIGEATSQ